MAEAYAHVTEYTVCSLPENNINYTSYAITVSYRGRGLWAVTRHRFCLNKAGIWGWESMPSERTDEWLAENRFTRAEALRLAKLEAPKVVVNGFTVADVLARGDR